MPKMTSRFMTIQFLYQTVIGRAILTVFTKDHVSNGENADCAIEKATNDPKLEKDTVLAEYVHSIPKAIRFKGVMMQGYLVYPKVLARIERLEVRRDDVWLCTYPKSGTTWTEEILSLIFADGDLQNTSSQLLAKRVPHLEVGKPIGHLKWLKSIESPRLLATHLNAQSIPAQLRQAKAKIIYVVRNPKDNAVSYYHHHQMSKFLGNYSGSWDNFVGLFARGQLVYGDWFEHVKGFWELKQKNPDSVLFVAYEELKVDLKKMIGVITEFVGRPLSPQRIDLIAQLCTFEKMKNNCMVNREKLPVSDLFDMNRCKFMRKGIIGDWKNHFDQQQSQLFDQVFTDRLAAIGLNLAYDHAHAQQIMAKQGRIIDS